mmetsp:Transcript_69535/g.108785  ORF Transcript_69535/g.108785 Transcript_69535/m.108785 type:complete len:104 (+) Transcript_69535:1113-1424(+)
MPTPVSVVTLERKSVLLTHRTSVILPVNHSNQIPDMLEHPSHITAIVGGNHFDKGSKLFWFSGGTCTHGENQQAKTKGALQFFDMRCCALTLGKSPWIGNGEF